MPKMYQLQPSQGKALRACLEAPTARAAFKVKNLWNFYSNREYCILEKKPPYLIFYFDVLQQYPRTCNHHALIVLATDPASLVHRKLPPLVWPLPKHHQILSHLDASPQIVGKYSRPRDKRLGFLIRTKYGTLADLVVGQDGLVGHPCSPPSPLETHDIFNCR